MLRGHLDLGYMSGENHQRLIAGYEEVGRMLSGMIDNPTRFAPVKQANR